ncbi:hypothetical protein AVEN_275654-1 [Araneus ventricosus]|uniref:Uncharacterized protein n=1 Tax=Araneus ventricosus TaxID=182803 RepID=A0A4Y2T8P7_ARAVE|nr:hypothetical protein AVEN_275654-1 [Araneus ventricosus]
MSYMQSNNQGKLECLICGVTFLYEEDHQCASAGNGRYTSKLDSLSTPKVQLIDKAELECLICGITFLYGQDHQCRSAENVNYTSKPDSLSKPNGQLRGQVKFECLCCGKTFLVRRIASAWRGRYNL